MRKVGFYYSFSRILSQFRYLQEKPAFMRLQGCLLSLAFLSKTPQYDSKMDSKTDSMKFGASVGILSSFTAEPASKEAESRGPS